VYHVKISPGAIPNQQSSSVQSRDLPAANLNPDSVRESRVGHEKFSTATVLTTKPLDYPEGNCHALTDNGTRGSTGESEVAGLGQGIG
jgi:hypothetical protein